MQNQPEDSPSIIVLVYHRVDIAATNPWGICITPDIFEKQVEFLKNNFHMVGVDDVIKQLTRGDIIEDSVCITFDDGYADNYLNALPVLEKYNCPATFFIATAFINTLSFWWDELEILLLHTEKLPALITLDINGNKYEYINSVQKLTREQWQHHVVWKWYEAPPTDRCGLFLQIWERLRSLDLHEIKKQIDIIKKLAGTNTLLPPLPLNADQLRLLSATPFCSIGLHTHTHPDLNGKAKQMQAKEIISCKQNLETNYRIVSNYLAYPYGRFDNNTLKAVSEVGLTACFTTENISIDDTTSAYKLGRCQVGNWNADCLRDNLRGWKTKNPK
jgi:peptidoglycan/xylan/chitin deacetylase (PgdA/CDA1 family)